MFCQNCFKSVRSDAQVCEHCGAEIEYKTYKVPTTKDVVTKYMNFARRIWKAVLCTTLVIVFLLLLALWCLIGMKLASLPMLKAAIARYKHILVPVVFIALGIYILLDSGLLSWF